MDSCSHVAAPGTVKSKGEKGAEPEGLSIDLWLEVGIRVTHETTPVCLGRDTSAATLLSSDRPAQIEGRLIASV